MKIYKRIIAVILLCIITIASITFSGVNVQASALDNETIVETPDFRPSFSDINIDIDESLIVSYEDIDIDEYECSLSADGINATIIEDNGYLQCEIEAIGDVEFGTLTVNAIASDGTELTNTIYTYNNGEKLFYSEFAKDQAWFDGTKELYEKGLDYFTYKYWEEEYSQLMSSILSGIPTVMGRNNNVTTISGSISWEIDNNHTTMPLKNAYVEVISKGDYVYTVLASGYTDVNGAYSLEISNDLFSQYSDVYFRINLEAYTFKVRSGWHTFAYYFDKKISDIADAGDTINFSPCVVYSESLKIYKATYVHQSMVIAERFAKEMGFETTNKIRVAYPAGDKNNTDSNSLSNSAFCWGDVIDNCYCAIGWHNYNDTNTVVHEYSHYIQCSLGNYGEPLHEIILEWPKHNPDDNQYLVKGDKSFAMHLTWTEGWGYAFAVMAQRYYKNEYVLLNDGKNDTYQTYISTPNNNTYLGEFQEKSINVFLWSLVDEGLVNSDINYDEFALDYKLPWTPQEWWNMTTISGTYRLPDFINLIENESYNFNLNLDYQSIREYLYDKLTLFNIAPEIVSATPSVPNASPVITWNPNGSPSANGKYYANNKFVIRLWDENWNQLYEYEKTILNVDRFTNCTHQIPNDIWNQIISGKDCLTFFYIGVEGYRVDDVNDIYATSGPYSSKYFVYRLNKGHQKSYTDLLDGTHRYECTTCGIDILFEHQIKYKNYLGNHCEECNLCDYCNVTSSHNYTEYYRDETYHVVKCEDCGYVNDNNHYYGAVCNSKDSTYHTYECTTCGYLKYEKHTSQYTNLDSDPNYHGIICTKCNYSSNKGLHDWGYRIINNQRHEKYCLYCGYSAGRSLHVLKSTEAGRYKQCTVCGIWVDTGLNDIFPIQGLPPKDPEEETE